METLKLALQQLRNIVFLTGAGVSVPSGIPDYRSKNGLYQRSEGRQPEYLLSEQCLMNEPDLFYSFVKTKMYYPGAKPNIIHQKIAMMEQSFHKQVTTITQNIDGLHEAAGAKDVVNFHGSLSNCYCIRCGAEVRAEDYLKSNVHANCGGMIRPDVVLYGEGIQAEAFERAVSAVRHAELIVIVGTSFQVSPFCHLIDYRNPEVQVFAINKNPLELNIPFVMVTGDAAQVFQEV
ncbi:NAD-dependent protein deacylase [Listeria sp. PSOL-1]|uniref:NAD-dependent protein deacylase n=1 Tax=Listeria sp. PSOL-1 TaxID=1844999 RepID=UPI00351BC079